MLLLLFGKERKMVRQGRAGSVVYSTGHTGTYLTRDDRLAWWGGVGWVASVGRSG